MDTNAKTGGEIDQLLGHRYLTALCKSHYFSFRRRGTNDISLFIMSSRETNRSISQFLRVHTVVLIENVVPFSERKRIAFIRIIVDINCLKDEKTTVSYKWRCERVIKGPLRIGKSKRKYGLFIKQTTIRNVNEFLHARGNYLTRGVT